MSIASEISRLQNSKADVKTIVNKDKDLINSGTAFIDDETVDDYDDKIAEMQDAYKKFIPIQTTSGTEITLDNSSNDKALIDIGLEGNTEQETTTGKNKIGPLTNIIANDTSAITVTYTSDSITVKHLVTTAWKGLYETFTGFTANATMTISVTATTTTTTGWGVAVRNSGGGIIQEVVRQSSGTRASVTFTVPSDGSFTIRLYAGYGDVAVNDTAVYSNISLNEGTDTTYEPYTGRNGLA